MDSIKHIYGLIVTLIAVLMSACSQDEAIGVASTETIPIELNIRDYKVLPCTRRCCFLSKPYPDIAFP